MKILNFLMICYPEGIALFSLTLSLTSKNANYNCNNNDNNHNPLVAFQIISDCMETTFCSRKVRWKCLADKG